MKKLHFIISILLVSSFSAISVNAEAITSDNIECFQLSFKPLNRQNIVKTLKMPTPLTKVVPMAENNNEKKPAGILPISIDPKTGKVVVLFGYEQGNITGFTDFGGSGDPTDLSREHTAVREFNEETCLAFWEDLTNQPLNRKTTSGSQLEALAKKTLTENVIPWFYAARNIYLACVLPVRYQSIADINKSISLVRPKVKASPFFEKTDFVWIPLEDFVGWIENGIENPTIPNGSGRPISWRFLGGSLENFKDLKTSGFKWLYDRVIQYLKDIIVLNS